jgi:hypothetical protein
LLNLRSALPVSREPVEKIIAFCSPFHQIFGYAYFATEEVA